MVIETLKRIKSKELAYYANYKSSLVLPIKSYEPEKICLIFKIGGCLFVFCVFVSFFVLYVCFFPRVDHIEIIGP